MIEDARPEDAPAPESVEAEKPDPTEKPEVALVASPTEPPRPPDGLGRALSLLGVSVTMTLLVFGAFYVYQTRARDLTAPLLSAAVSILAVLLPSLIAFHWPRTGAPGRLPAYDRPGKHVVAGVFFVSLPLYALSAAVLLGAGAWDPARQAAEAPAAGPGLLGWLGIWLAFAALPAVAEELMYRGMIQPAIAQRWGPVWGIAVTATLFSFIHMEPAGLLPRMLMGAWFGYLAWRTGSLWTPTWAHALNNTWAVVLLAAGQGLVVSQSALIAGLSLASLVGAAWCFHQAGWMPVVPAAAKPGDPAT